jgi:protein-disulfide isomerase
MLSTARENRRRLYQVGGLVVSALAILIVAITALSGPSVSDIGPGKPVPRASEVLALLNGIPQHGVVLGDRGAPVTLVEFGDLQCSACAVFAENTLAAIIARFVRSGKVQVVFRGLAFLGADSTRAARMAGALGEQGHLWQFIDLVYYNQGLENSSYVTDRYLRGLAGAIPDANVARAMIDRNSAVVSDQLRSASQDAHSLHLKATPSLLIGRTGRTLRSVVPSEVNASSLTALVDEVLAGAG